jgi:hypothetical protein
MAWWQFQGRSGADWRIAGWPQKATPGITSNQPASAFGTKCSILATTRPRSVPGLVGERGR